VNEHDPDLGVRIGKVMTKAVLSWRPELYHRARPTLGLAGDDVQDFLQMCHQHSQAMTEMRELIQEMLPHTGRSN